MASIPKTERLINLIALLLKARTPVSWQAIRQSVVGYAGGNESDESLLRRFERDKATLREIGVPVEYVPDDGFGNEGYAIERGGYFLPHLQLSPEEVAVLALAARAAQASGPLGAAMQSALTKLEFDSPIPGDVRSTVEEHFLFYHPESDGDAEQSQKLEALSAAVLANRTIAFDYLSMQADTTSPRTVDPYGLAFWSGHWYLAGHSHERDAVRTYRVDRIEGAVSYATERETADFEPPEGFDIERYVGRPPWRLRSEHAQTVRIHFDATVAWMVRERPQEGDQWTDRGDGSATLDRRATDPDALLRWLLRFGAHAEILAPVELRQTFTDLLRRIRTRYAHNAGGAA